MLIIIIINSASGEIENFGNFQKDNCITLRQTCSNCTYTNISSVLYPNATLSISEVPMTKIGTDYNYSYCKTNTIGQYIVNGYSNVDGIKTVWAYNFYVTETGDTPDSNQGYMVLAQLGMIALFLSLGFSFSREKWKVRTLFFMAALLMGIITLNSIRVIAGTSSKLSSMGNVGLVLGIIMLTFMFMYILIYYTIEVFKYFREKRRMRWEVNSNY
jgi:hypothetical protein